MQHLVSVVVQCVEIAALFYFIILNSLYLVFSVFAYGVLVRHRRRWTPRHLGAIMRSPATPAVSIVVPAYNERTGIVDTVRSLLMLNYPQFEVIVVNDGSTDDTLTVLRETFGLVEAPCNHASEVATQPVRAIYRSLAIREIVVIDKANGGKADATNAGLNAAQFPLMCLIDADSVLEEHALTRAVLPFLENSTTVAVGGIVRIGNGCVIDQGRVTDVRAPRGLLARFQIIEYLRSFLAARVTQSAMNSLLIVSGAFGVFRRDIVIAAGGWRTDTVGEDMEIIVRLHRFCRENDRPYRVVFQPDPVVWTEAPETLAVLSRQRNRWQRGTLQVLGAHSAMFGSPRYGRIGLLALPYYAIFEGIGPDRRIGGRAEHRAGAGVRPDRLASGAALHHGRDSLRDDDFGGIGAARRAVVPPLPPDARCVPAAHCRRARELRLPAAHHVVAPPGLDRLLEGTDALGRHGPERIVDVMSIRHPAGRGRARHPAHRTRGPQARGPERRYCHGRRGCAPRGCRRTAGSDSARLDDA